VNDARIIIRMAIISAHIIAPQKMPHVG